MCILSYVVNRLVHVEMYFLYFSYRVEGYYSVNFVFTQVERIFHKKHVSTEFFYDIWSNIIYFCKNLNPPSFAQSGSSVE